MEVCPGQIADHHHHQRQKDLHDAAAEDDRKAVRLSHGIAQAGEDLEPLLEHGAEGNNEAGQAGVKKGGTVDFFYVRHGFPAAVEIGIILFQLGVLHPFRLFPGFLVEIDICMEFSWFHDCSS